MNKGFTLIELIAIIAVLAAIFLVSFPLLLNTAKSDEDKKYNNMVENLCLSGKAYIYSSMSDYEELSIVNSKIEININDLVAYGNVDKDLINPITHETVTDDKLIYEVLSDYSLDCKYVES